MTEQSPPPPESDAKPVPEELLRKLHEANTRFHKDKEQVEAAMDDTDIPHQQRVNQAEEELRRAEGEVEEADRRIQEALNKPT